MSFPRKRESSKAYPASAAVLWIPACAGMTRFLRPPRFDRQPLEPDPAAHRLLRRQDARIDAIPGDFAGQAAIFDFRAAIHDDFDARRLGLRRGGVIADRELHPDHF